MWLGPTGFPVRKEFSGICVGLSVGTREEDDVGKACSFAAVRGLSDMNAKKNNLGHEVPFSTYLPSNDATGLNLLSLV